MRNIPLPDPEADVQIFILRQRYPGETEGKLCVEAS